VSSRSACDIGVFVESTIWDWQEARVPEVVATPNALPDFTKLTPPVSPI